MSPWDLLGAVGLIAGGLAAWLLVLLFAVALCKARARPVPPAGPRVRVVRSRERAGRVEFLPVRGDAENAREAGRRG